MKKLKTNKYTRFSALQRKKAPLKSLAILKVFFREGFKLTPVSEGVILAAVLFASILVRWDSFYLSHANGDQNYYLSLAMKLDREGFSGYNLRRVNQFITGAGDIQHAILEIRLAMPSEEGSLIKSFQRSGVVKDYDVPLFYRPYALPLTVMLSHRLFAPNDPSYKVVAGHLGEKVTRTKPKVFFSIQFYCTIIPFVFSLGCICLVFLLGRLMFSPEVGLLSSYFMAFNPVEILCSYKLWTEEILCFFLLLSVVFFWKARAPGKYSALFYVLSGISCGISVLAKQSAGFIVFAYVAFHMIGAASEKTWTKRLLKCMDWRFALFFAGLFIVTFHWFWNTYLQYGHPLYQPSFQSSGLMDTSGWFETLKKRPKYLLYPAGIPYLFPPFIFAYAGIWKALRTIRRPEHKAVLLSFLWVAAFYFFFATGKEHRYMLPAYGAISFLACEGLEQCRVRLNLKARGAGNAFVFLLMLSAPFWSVPIAMDVVYKNEALIMKPF